MVRVEVAPIEDGKAGEAAPYNLVLGQNQAIPELEERIMSLQAGETAETEVKFPDDHPDEARRGQSRKVRITLHDVKRQELPPLDDAFAREVGEFDSLQALTDAVRKDLEADAVRTADQQVRSALVNELVAANAVPAPESLVHRWLHAYAEMYGVPADQLPQFEQQFHAIAETQVKRDLVLDAVIEREKLAATEAEIDERISQLAAGRGVSAGEYYQQVQKAGRLPEIERSISEEKAFAWLLGQSTVVEA
jgi:trigger factor